MKGLLDWRVNADYSCIRNLEKIWRTSVSLSKSCNPFKVLFLAHSLAILSFHIKSKLLTMSMEYNDLFEEGSSNCCGAKVYLPGICSDCKEHCEAVAEEEITS